MNPEALEAAGWQPPNRPFLGRDRPSVDAGRAGRRIVGLLAEAPVANRAGGPARQTSSLIFVRGLIKLGDKLVGSTEGLFKVFEARGS